MDNGTTKPVEGDPMVISSSITEPPKPIFEDVKPGIFRARKQ